MAGRHHRAFRLLASTVTAAALAVPATAAAGGNAVTKGPAGVDIPGTSATYGVTPGGKQLQADTEAFAATHEPTGPPTGAGAGPALTYAPANDSNPILQNDIRHFGSSSDIPRYLGNPVVVRVEGGFDWTAAGVGAAGGVGLALVVGAGTFGLRRRQRVEAARA